MGTIARPNTYTANTTIEPSEVNDDFNTIYNEFNGAISSANLATDAVTTAKIADSNVTTIKIADANVTVDKMAATMGAGTAGTGAWDSWTPTLSGITIGNGTVVAKYIQIGKTVIAAFTFTFGSSSTMGTGIVSLPVTASANYTVTKNDLGSAVMDDAGTNYIGIVRLETTTTVRPIVGVANATYLSGAGLSSSVPMTWATGDILTWTITYEAA
jgi:hypothetical protein